MTLTFATCKTLDDFEKLFPLRTGFSDKAEITRIAPSPTGMPHIGTAMQAVLDRALADKDKGLFLLRIEDTDRARTVPGAVDAIIDGLKWLNMIPDEGTGFGGEYGPYTQSERLPLYQIACNHLIETGHAYKCFCTSDRLDELRNLQVANKKTPMYDRKCRSLTSEQVQANIDAGLSYVVRMVVPDNEKINVFDEVRGKIVFDSSTLDDSIILKTDGYPTYHLAAIVDDHFMRVTTVVRGEEWVPSTPKHLLLYRSFGWTAPRFLHTVLLRDPEKRKLSKRSGDTSLNWFRRQGFLKEGFTNFLTRVMWAHPESKDVYPFSDFVKLLKTENLPSTGPVADMKLLQFINNRYISDMNNEERANAFVSYLKYLLDTNQTASNSIDPEVDAEDADPAFLKTLHKNASEDMAYTAAIMSIKPGRYDRLADMIFSNGYFYDALYHAPSADQLLKHGSLEDAADILEKFIAGYTASPENVEPMMKEIAKGKGVQDKQVFMTLRLALSGSEKTPPIPEILPVMGHARVVARMDQVIQAIRTSAAA